MFGLFVFLFSSILKQIFYDLYYKNGVIVQKRAQQFNKNR